MIEGMDGCGACGLGQPEIIGRQYMDDAGDAMVTNFRVQCATCGHGREGSRYPTPGEAVKRWNGSPVTVAVEAVDPFAS